MKTLRVSSSNFTKRNLVAVGGASMSAKELADGTVVTCTAAALISDQRDDGEVRDVAAFVLDDGSVISSVSENLREITPDVCEIIDEEGPVSLKILHRVAKSGREFLSALIL